MNYIHHRQFRFLPGSAINICFALIFWLYPGFSKLLPPPSGSDMAFPPFPEFYEPHAKPSDFVCFIIENSFYLGKGCIYIWSKPEYTKF
jgi:hypothetical protein